MKNMNNTIHRIKMFKSKKTWVTMGTTMLILGLGNISGNLIHADEIKPVETTIAKTAKVKSAAGQTPINSAQKIVKSDKANIKTTKSLLSEAQTKNTKIKNSISTDNKSVKKTQTQINKAVVTKNNDQKKLTV